MCTDHYAMMAGRLAFLEAKLSVSDAQRPAFNQWRDTVLSDAKSRQQDCLAHTPSAPHDRAGSALQREAMEEKMLSARLQALQSQRPALETLYNSLTPEQKLAFDESGRHWMHRHGEGHGDAPHVRG
jgi:Spy/CpxP family protein refolding chaperone